ncbi:PLP-dependent aminotransferase family protein [Kocuria marina]|uniref:aminotransferase-like domain-containing protein n=1 Tax=Kocuria marina TaxID=223184 RepID=UPI0021A91C17|nr:PLP-dependent aminotransferase family protein [Kocuria marina]MCT1617317.1 PLP-dependent aminotransferase family protein [Kocuria marina]
MRHARDTDLPLTVDRTASTGLGEQLVRQIRELVARGVLRPGDPLPSSRALAARLGISRGTVTAAWDVLAGEGYLVADRGATRITPHLEMRRDTGPVARAVATTAEAHRARLSGPEPGGDAAASPRVGQHSAPTSPRTGMPVARIPAPTTSPAPPSPRTARRSAARPEVIDLRPGKSTITSLDTPAWRGAWRDAASGVATGRTLRTDLRDHLADYLRLNRGIVRSPEDILVTAGVRDGLQLALRVLGLARGRRLRVAVENPGYPALRRVVRALGHIALPVGVDEHGLVPEQLPSGRWGGAGRWDVAPAPDAIVLTPGHQYPLGGTMPVTRRMELLAWAREHGALVLEDDYDSELRHSAQPLPALGALDTARDTVVTLGSFAKVLGSSVGVGHLVAPDSLLPDLERTRAELGSPVSLIAQEALARFMDSGEFQRHTARMRRSFRRRRLLLSDVLGDLPHVSVLPMAGGAHAVLAVPDEDAAIERARRRGVLVGALAEYWTGQGRAGGERGGAAASSTEAEAEVDRKLGERGGVVLGLTALDRDVERGARVLREVLGEP